MDNKMEKLEQIFSQISTQHIPNFPSRLQLNGIVSRNYPLQGQGDLHCDWRKDPEIAKLASTEVLKLVRSGRNLGELVPSDRNFGERVGAIASKLENRLFYEATSKEEYMDERALDRQRRSNPPRLRQMLKISRRKGISKSAKAYYVHNFTTSSADCITAPMDSIIQSAVFLGEVNVNVWRSTDHVGNNQNVYPMDFHSKLHQNSGPRYSSLQIPQQAPQIQTFQEFQQQSPQPYMLFDQPFEAETLYDPGMQAHWTESENNRCFQLEIPGQYQLAQNTFQHSMELELGPSISNPFMQEKSLSQLAGQNVSQHPYIPSKESIGARHLGSENLASYYDSNGVALSGNISRELKKYMQPSMHDDWGSCDQPLEAQIPCDPGMQARWIESDNNRCFQSEIPGQYQLAESQNTFRHTMELEPSISAPFIQDESFSQLAGQIAAHCGSNGVSWSGNITCDLQNNLQYQLAESQNTFQHTMELEPSISASFMQDKSLSQLAGQNAGLCGSNEVAWSGNITCDLQNDLQYFIHDSRDNCDQNCHYDGCSVSDPSQGLSDSQPFDPGLGNSENGNKRTSDDREAGRPTGDTSEDMQFALKCRKMEHHPSLPSSLDNETFHALASSVEQPHASQGLPQMQRRLDAVVSVNSDVMEVNKEFFTSPIQDATDSSEIRIDDPDKLHRVNNDVEPLPFNNLDSSCQRADIWIEAKPALKHDFSAPEFVHIEREKSLMPKILGASLTEQFTPEQIMAHLSNLRKWGGQKKAKKDMNHEVAHAINKNSCQLCGVLNLSLRPQPLYCSCCNAVVKRNLIYYSTLDENGTQYCFCKSCYGGNRHSISVSGVAFRKAKLEKMKNDEEIEESWVQCDRCEGWQHQICALFNEKRNVGGDAEYICPNCHLQEIETGKRKPLPPIAVLGAKDLPRTSLSDHVEQRLFKHLKQERKSIAKATGMDLYKVPEAEDLVVRVVYSANKQLKVNQRFLDTFQNYPTELPYRSKIIFLFQKIDGVDTCLFGMHVQEFGSDCPNPNNRCVYLSYLDSVKYFTPETKTVTGEPIGYLDYCKKRGFSRCYIWTCPPSKGEDYIFNCHPEIQKTPKPDKLREWYLAMLRKATKENIVVDFSNLFDYFFVPNGNCEAKITATRLPYFDGYYWPSAAENLIKQIEKEGEGRTTRGSTSKRASRSMGHKDPSSTATKDILLMRKLKEAMFPWKEDFIMVHLQFACTRCCEVILSGKRRFCSLCRNFQLCEKCHDAEQYLSSPYCSCNGKENALSQVEVNDVPFDTENKDGILDCEFFESGTTFLSFCQKNQYQYDTLRRAKHSSMMILHHLHNPTSLVGIPG